MKHLSALGILALLATPAAADPVDWAGFYAGLYAGGGAGTVAATNTGNSRDFYGPSAGAFVGHSWTMDGVILGLEGDVNWTGMAWSDPTAHLGLDAWVSASARVGVPLGQVMPFASIGVAAATGHIRTSAYDVSAMHLGLITSLGAEAALTDQMSIRAEVGKLHFFESPYTLPVPSGVATMTYDGAFARAGIAFKLQ